ncbi:MAG: putative DNA binding domain-containing protein [Acidobacteria bacterium]|nr:putative DNA binding domain-containing protein [Acidobacteriota bacterium]
MSRHGIPERESLHVEFKSDAKRLPDSELVLAAVCLANTEGGVIYLGVEDDGTITGLRPDHQDTTGIAVLIANKTVPPLSVRSSLLEVAGRKVAKVEVPRSTRLVATSGGTLQRRRLMADGAPACVPFLPHEFATRESDLGLADVSALPVAGAREDALDPVERQRLRQAIERYKGDRSLLTLDDAQLDGALGLSRTQDGNRVPTLTGLLLIGREDAIRDHVPTHEVAFQVLSGTSVRVNDFYRWPLIRLFERVEEQFHARVEERELQAGLYRVPVPNADPGAFREAFLNALAHRDYTRLGAIHVRWSGEVLTVSSPGGFVEGVTLQNLLVVEPRPRNPRLADAIKRVGLAERTGRGVDLIFQGLLRYGRPAPDYGRSDAAGVAVDMSCREADLGFLEIVLEHEKRLGGPLAIDGLIVLAKLREVRRADTAELGVALQKDAAAARSTLESLLEAGLVQAHGVKKGRTYTLSPAVYKKLGRTAAYVRQVGFDKLQQEQLILKLIEQQGSIRRRDVIDLCRLSADQAKRLLSALVERGVLRREGADKSTVYERA